MLKIGRLLIVFMGISLLGVLLLSNMCVLSAAEYKISGYIEPDLSYASGVSSMMLEGTKVELYGTSISGECDGNGYFEIKAGPGVYAIKISKPMFLAREIKDIQVDSDIFISLKESPLKIRAGDVNNDNAINMMDIVLAAAAFNSSKGDARYSGKYDFNMDNAVNMNDIIIISRHFNTACSNYPAVNVIKPTGSPTPTATMTPTPTITLTPTGTPTPTATKNNALPSVSKTEDIKMALSGLTAISYGGYLNGESFQQDGITTYNGYQYSAFWNTNKHVVMCRRKLPDGAWAKFEFTDHTLSAQDAHNTISIGICPGDGTIHLAFDHHGNDLRYRVSKTGLATNPTGFAWAASDFGDVRNSLAGGAKISLVTYPRFITVPGGSRMLFEYRYGTSGSGDQYLLEYDAATHQWTSLGKYIDGITLNNNAYAHGISYDKNGRLHETWCWRETPDASTNHDLLYIYSDDNGRTWKNNAGVTVGVTGRTYIDKNTQGIKVWTINQNRGLINQEAQAVDNDGRIHVLLSHMRDSQGDDSNFTSARTRSVYFHYWRDSNGTWRRTEMGYSVNENLRGKIAFSTTNNIYAILPNIRIAAASATSNWSDWKLIDTNESGRFFSDPLIDTARLELEANTLTLYCPSPNSPNIYNLTYVLK